MASLLRIFDISSKEGLKNPKHVLQRYGMYCTMAKLFSAINIPLSNGACPHGMRCHLDVGYLAALLHTVEILPQNSAKYDANSAKYATNQC